MDVHIDKAVGVFIQSLEKSTIARVLRTLDLLETFGHQLGMPHSKKVAPGLLELRMHGAQEIRIFYCFRETQIVLLHGFVKKSDKIPSKELKVALSKLAALDSI